MENSPVASLDWFLTKEGELFPGCMTCCEVVGSPAAHEAASAEKLVYDDDLFDSGVVPSWTLPIYRAVLGDYHDRNHSFAPTPLTAVPKRRRRTQAISAAVVVDVPDGRL